MANRPPCYFFSYARKDWDNYLERFFREIERRVTQDGGLDPEKNETGFLDRKKIKAGSDWGNDLATALARGLVLLSIYTPWYFKRPSCGKEFQVFLDRQDQLTYEDDGSVKGSKKILPVLWVKKEHLGDKMPPVTKRIQFEPESHRSRYEQEGLRRILEKSGTRGPFADLANEFADLLLKLANDGPLPELSPLPEFEATRNAFAKDSAERDSLDPTGPQIVLVCALFGSVEWQPFGDLETGGLFPELAELASSQGLLTSVCGPILPDTDSQEVLRALIHASDRNSPVILLVDSDWLTEGPKLDKLETILASNLWRGALLVLSPHWNSIPDSTLRVLREAWASKRDISERDLLIQLCTSSADLASNFSMLLVDAQQRVSEHGQVIRRGAGGTTDDRPMLSGPGASV